MISVVAEHLSRNGSFELHISDAFWKFRKCGALRFPVTVKSEFLPWALSWEKKWDMLFEACDRCFVMFCTFAALFFSDDKTETTLKEGTLLSFFPSFYHSIFPFFSPLTCPFRSSPSPLFPTLSFLFSSWPFCHPPPLVLSLHLAPCSLSRRCTRY